MNPNAFTYYAFVSYSHKDEKWARWIQTALERYRLPAAVRKEAGKALPERIRPVFRDATDLGVGKLVDNLRQELEQSKFLIVVCSPNSALPNTEGKHWVNEEVVRFCELGRADRVIPVIVGGTKDTAYCPKLEEEDILGLDATKHPRERILNDLVAKILGLRPDELWRREERRLRAKRRRRVFGWCLAAALAALVAAGIWDCSRTVCNHYADYVDSFGLPEGIFPLGKTELEHRNFHYRFEYRGLQKAKDSPHADSADWSLWNALGFRRRLVRVVQANSRGYPCSQDESAFENRPQIQEFDYDGNARLCEIWQKRGNGDGRSLYLKERIVLYNDEEVVNGWLEFFSRNTQRSMAYANSSMSLSPDIGPFTSKSAIVQHEVKRDDKGRAVQCLFLNPEGSNVPDSDGLWGFSFEHDDLGRITARWNLGREGNGFTRRPNKKGVAGIKCEYSGRNARTMEYLDARGKQVFGDGAARWEADYDDWGNVLEKRSYGVDGQQRAAAETRYAYDEGGNRTKVSYFRGDGKPMLGILGVAEVRLEYDTRGELTKATYFGADGKPMLGNDGCAEIRWQYDEHTNTTKAAYFGMDGKPTLSKDGYAEVHWEYNERGNLTKASHFGVDGRPTQHKNGYAEIRWEYNDQGLVAKGSSFGVDGRLILGTDGYAEACWEYDTRGNLTKMSCFGVSGKPILCEDGWAELRMEYDNRGNTTKEAYFDVDGKPIQGKAGGISEIRREYDERGNLTRETYFGANGAVMKGADGFAEMHAEYDEYGNRMKEMYFDEDGKPILNPNGFAECRWEYDSRGNATKVQYFDMEGDPVLQADSFYEMRMEYDERGNMTKSSFFGLDGRPTLNTSGVSEVRLDYDKRGNMTQMSCFGEDSRPILNRYDWSEGRMEYDEQGNQTKSSYFDVDGKLTLCSDGYAMEIWQYDERKNATQRMFFGVDGKPILNLSGFAEIRWEYDSRGNMVKEMFFGVDGNPILNKDGYAGLCLEYDEYGNEVKLTFFGVDGQPVLCNDSFAQENWNRGSFAECHWAYDESGNVIREEYFGVDGELLSP